jgi:glycerol dehydrogenase-like iron-containing ADH family enzyme
LNELIAEGVKAYGGECIYCGNKKIAELRFMCTNKDLREKLLAMGGGKMTDATRVIARRGWKNKKKFVVLCKDPCAA